MRAIHPEDVPTDTKVVKRAGTPRKPSAAGKGRPKGAVNKITKSLKEAILGALELAGGRSKVGATGAETYLLRQARKKNPAPFLALIGKVLPATLTITGPEGKDLKITFEVVRPQAINDKSPQSAPSLPCETQRMIGG